MPFLFLMTADFICNFFVWITVSDYYFIEWTLSLKLYRNERVGENNKQDGQKVVKLYFQ